MIIFRSPGTAFICRVIINICTLALHQAKMCCSYTTIISYTKNMWIICFKENMLHFATLAGYGLIIE